MKHVFMKLGACIAVMVIALLPVMPVISSDVSDADFYGVIQTTNNSTAASSISSNVSGLNTSELIAAGYLNSSANNCAIRSSSGADIPFMPGYGSSPWLLFFGSLGADSISNSIAYFKGVTGGAIRYFPGATGGNVTDAAALEPGNNCRFDFSVPLTSSAFEILTKGNSANISYDGAGEITALVGDNYSQLSFASASSEYGHKDATVVYGATTALTIDAWAKRTTTGAFHVIASYGSYSAAATAGFAFYFTNTDKIYFDIYNNAGGQAVSWTSTNSTLAGTQYFISATYDNTRTPKTIVYVNGNVWGGTDTGVGGTANAPGTYLGIGATYVAAWGSFLNGTIDEVRISKTARTSSEHITAYNNGVGLGFNADANTISLYHMIEQTGTSTADAIGNNNLALVNTPTWVNTSPVISIFTASLSGLTGDEAIGYFIQDGTNAWLTVNNTSSANYTAVSIPNTSSNWVWGAGAPYIYGMRHYVSGILKGSWDWQYAATFTDASGNGNTFYPSFPSAGNDADVSSVLVSFQPIAEPTAPAFAVGEGPGFFDTSNVTTGNFTTGNVTLDYPLRDLIEDVATAGGVPYQIPSTFIASFCVIVLSMLTSFFLKRYSAQSIFLKTIVNTAAYGTLIALHIYDWWMLIFFFIFEASIWFGAQHRRE